MATYLLSDGTEKHQFLFTINSDEYKAFSEKRAKYVRNAFEGYGSALSIEISGSWVIMTLQLHMPRGCHGS